MLTEEIECGRLVSPVSESSDHEFSVPLACFLLFDILPVNCFK